MLTIQEIFKAAGVEQERKARYFTPDYRTCEHTANFVVAVETAIESANKEHMESERRLNAALIEANNRVSVLSAKLADMERKLRESEKIAIGLGIESLPEVTEATRKRIMNPTAA